MLVGGGGGHVGWYNEGEGRSRSGFPVGWYNDWGGGGLWDGTVMGRGGGLWDGTVMGGGVPVGWYSDREGEEQAAVCLQ